MNDEILEALKRIEKASAHTTAKIGSAFYTTGLLIALGMQHAGERDYLWALLSWMNVGYLAMKGAAGA